MKRTFLFIYFFITTVFILQAQLAVAVVDFDSGNYCTAQRAAIMTDLFRNELIRCNIKISSQVQGILCEKK